MGRLLRDESGFTLVELILVAALTVVLMAGVSDVFVSGLRTSSTTNAMLASQASVQTALTRLEFETRCASQATRAASGADVTLTLPGQCANAAGTVTWCVSGGTLTRYSGSSCSGSGQTFATSVTSATPFSCVATVGDYPELQVALSANAGTNSGTAVSETDTIDMRNASVTTANSAACT
ncbi:MAG TPA: prepilin-type N-terminal cleavage/methylation domain-containing protein [Gaiellaceae bacterium]|nr:prepilin-type N-terminal cleavage/methylation domain-containing protein [Gaiellaceae bacterium]